LLCEHVTILEAIANAGDITLQEIEKLLLLSHQLEPENDIDLTDRNEL
jgi:hypothetical protein